MAPRLPSTIPTLIHDPETKTLSLTEQPLLLPSPPVHPLSSAPEEAAAGAGEGSPSSSYLTAEHLIRVHAAALTSHELTWPEPQTARPFPIPAYELAGTVVLAPTGSPFPPGTEVIALTGFGRPGHARAYSTALGNELGRKPRGQGVGGDGGGVEGEENQRPLSWAEAAVVPMSGLTAWQALFGGGPGFLEEPSVSTATTSSSNAAKRVLITAASGGVGIFAVQLAKLAGAHVVATCGPSNIEFVRSLGADEVLDYRQVTDLGAWARQGRDGDSDDQERKFDVVLDCVGGATLTQAWLAARKDGLVVSVAEPVEARRPKEGVEEGVQGRFFIVDADRRVLESIATLIEEGKCRVVVDKTFKLDEYENAFERVNGRHLRGKVVLVI
ncbi:hypothetical protein BX600DRAFT_288675 [Xylariales sp. PMI_506]|nr:hypothetical protein BX600DRAFT_288675 [Xylariales sp. PMI_506]